MISSEPGLATVKHHIFTASKFYDLLALKNLLHFNLAYFPAVDILCK